MSREIRIHTRHGKSFSMRPNRPTEAVALAYDPNKDRAPRVLARGKGELAEAIITKASEHGVAIVSDRVALEALRFIDVGQEIPPKVYHLVAEILAFVYNLGDRPKDHP